MLKTNKYESMNMHYSTKLPFIPNESTVYLKNMKLRNDKECLSGITGENVLSRMDEFPSQILIDADWWSPTMTSVFLHPVTRRI